MHYSRKKLGHEQPPWVKDGAIYFITICAQPKGANELCKAETAAALFDSIEHTRMRGVWWPFLVLLMPDHLHGLISFAIDPGMQKTITDWKHYTSRKFGIRWQRDFFDHRLRSDECLDEKAAYIRANPVRAGLTAKAEDWPYVREWRTLMSVR